MHYSNCPAFENGDPQPSSGDHFPAASMAAPRLSVGSSLASGRLEIRGRVGEGGMGLVYEAYDWVRDERVALKTGYAVHPEGIYRLKREFRALKRVKHPNLVGLYGLFAEPERWYFTMELVDGSPFGTWLTSVNATAANDADLRRAFLQLARGVSAIHQAGKVHRDLKPSNVVITSEGRVVILDFGLVCDPTPGGVGQTQEDGRISGTPAYLAPEQGYGGPASEASDWYAFGVMLFQALTRELPYSAHNLVAHRCSGGVPNPQHRNPHVSDAIAHLCQRLLQCEPEKRADAREVLAVLSNVPTLGLPRPPLARLMSKPQGSSDRLEAGLSETRAGKCVVSFAGSADRIVIEDYVRTLDHTGRALVLRGQCCESEAIPYTGLDGVVDDLSHYLVKLSRDRAASLLPRDIRALSQVFPVLNRVDVIAEFPERRACQDDFGQRSQSALIELLARIRDHQPLVLVLENLEHATTDTLTLLEQLLTLEQLPIQVLFHLSGKPTKGVLKLLLGLKRCAWITLSAPSAYWERHVPTVKSSRSLAMTYNQSLR
jgi:eukaryotic-like serine/threonine-protein kinase